MLGITANDYLLGSYFFKKDGEKWKILDTQNQTFTEQVINLLRFINMIKTQGVQS